ncbi:unnamed protein product, partial [marine sediment metagenome]
MNKIEFIKKEFGNHFTDVSTAWEPEVEHDNLLYKGRQTHCRSGLYTFVRMLKAKYVLEIGSWCYNGSHYMGKAMDAEGIDGRVDSIDIMPGGFGGEKIDMNTINKRVKPYYWMPHHTPYDDWKYTADIVHPEFRNMTDVEIYERNIKWLKSIAPENGYDLIMIDGDHSYIGIKWDWKYVNEVCHNETVIVIDD